MVNCNFKYFSPKRFRIIDKTTQILRYLDLSSESVSILFTNDAHITELNHHYRGVNQPTDVLSFSQTEGDPIPSLSNGAPPPLGDIVISIDAARRNAKIHRVTLGLEIDLLLTHGILHLLGYDHEDKCHALTMRKMENEILCQINPLKANRGLITRQMGDLLEL